MHVFLSLAQAAALMLGQAEPAESAAAEPAAAAQEPAPRAEPAPPDPEAAVARPPPRATTQPGGERQAPDAAASPAPPPSRTSEPERAQVARAALAFLDALLASDAAGLAAASAERFSFDGDLRTGKDEIRRAWRAALAGRDAAQRGALLDLELLPAADAVARLGAPPPRIAPLAARGSWVAIANVSRRPVVLFLAREAGRFAVIGME